MLFSSPIFIFLFLPIVLILFYLSPQKIRNLILLIASLVFYAWGGVSFTGILILSLILNYFTGRGVASENKKTSQIYLIIGIILNLLILVIFKYTNFIIENLNHLFSGLHLSPVKQTNIALPIGISFFTFQALSYLIDIYRKEAKMQKSFVNLALYISLFPQLIAGPIVRYHDICKQLIKRSFTFEKFAYGIERFIFGLSKKVLLANNFACIADEIFLKPAELITTPVAWIGIVSYSFQIYFDFSGYSDMAIGLGKMLGFEFLENFNFPYISKSIREFWRRWHISLSTWFRDYLYIPLGGNRSGNRKTYVNLFIVFLLTGFWHGASWNFIVWGLFHGFFLIIERIGFSRILDKIWKPFQHFYTLLIVTVSWVFFRADNITYAFGYCKVLFGKAELIDNNQFLVYFDQLFIVLLIISITGSGNFLSWLYKKINGVKTINYRLNNIVRIILLFILLYLSCASLLSGTYNPFIYFRF